MGEFNETEQRELKNLADNIIKVVELAKQDSYPPIALTHFSFDKRMSSQESVFTIQDDIEKPFSPQDGNRLKKIIILKPYLIKAELIKLGVVESKIYPSVSGLLNSLKFIHINENFKFID